MYHVWYIEHHDDAEESDMPDDRYLDGDPRADEGRFLFTDLTPFVQEAEQEFRLLLELIQTGRRADAEQVAMYAQVRAERMLEKLEAPKLPGVDVEKSPNVADRPRRVYKQGEHS